MRVSIVDLQREEVGANIPFSLAEPAPKLADLTDLKGLSAEGVVTKLDGGFLVAGAASARLPLECARCLKEFSGEVRTGFDEEFVRKPADDQFGYAKGELDLAPMLRTVLLLALPDRPLHDPDCQGLCVVCGKDLNENPHRHQAAKQENPFSELKKLPK